MLGTIDEVRTNSQLTFSYGHASFGRAAGIYIYQLYVDTRCSLEGLARPMDDKYGWRKRNQGKPCWQPLLMYLTDFSPSDDVTHNHFIVGGT